jgi:hypothetical protein
MTLLYFTIIASFWASLCLAAAIISYENNRFDMPNWWKRLRDTKWGAVLFFASIFGLVVPLIFLFSLPD